MAKFKNVVWHNYDVGRKDREKIKGHKSCIVWLTGLPSSGKSTIAQELERLLNKMNMHTYVLDGDNVRHGLSRDLGFSDEDRAENMRRIGEVAKLFVDAGIIVITAFIAPFRRERDRMRRFMKNGEFFEVYVKCPLEICKRRDPKGLYTKAISGKIKYFTGVDHLYEEPASPELTIESDKLSIGESVRKILDCLARNNVIDKERLYEHSVRCR